MVKIDVVKINKPTETNLILGQSHFIKTVEDLHETLVTAVPGIKFGLAFSEASSKCLVRTSGTDEKLEKSAAENVLKIGCGHCFLILLANAFPINVLNAIKQLAEITSLYCASANPVEVITIKTKQGGGILGIIDGTNPKGIEKNSDKKERQLLLRKIGYKF